MTMLPNLIAVTADGTGWSGGINYIPDLYSSVSPCDAGIISFNRTITISFQIFFY